MSEEYPFESQKEKRLPNPETQALHKKETRKEIYLPFVLSLIGLAIFVLILITKQIGSVEVWSDISMIFLTIISLGIGVVILMLVVSLVFGMYHLIKNIPPYTRSIQDAVKQIENQVRNGAKVSIQPILKIQEFTKQMNDIFNIKSGSKKD